jgi:hypothetical protein
MGELKKNIRAYFLYYACKPITSLFPIETKTGVVSDPFGRVTSDFFDPITVHVGTVPFGLNLNC